MVVVWVFVPCVTQPLIQSCNVDLGALYFFDILLCFASFNADVICVSFHCFHFRDGLWLSLLLALGLGFLLALLIFFFFPCDLSYKLQINRVSIQLLSLYIVYFKNYFNCAIVRVQCDVTHNDLV